MANGGLCSYLALALWALHVRALAFHNESAADVVATTADDGDDPCATKGCRAMCLASYDDTLACLNKLMLPAAEVYHTLAHLQHGVTTLYSFERIAVNSQKGSHRVGNGCQLPVHPVAVDLPQKLDEVRRWALVELGLAQDANFEQLLDSKDSVPAYAFHQQLWTIFRDLLDAHTLYLPPYLRHFPVHRYYIGDSIAKIRVLPQEPSQAFPVVEMWYRDGWWEVEMMEGRPKAEVFAQLAEYAKHSEGNYKSLGARVNAYLNAWGTGEFRVLPLPQKGTMKVSLRKGTETADEELVVKVLRVMPMGLKQLQDATTTSPTWEALRKWIDAHLHLKGEARLKAFADIPAAFRAEATARPELEFDLLKRPRRDSREEEPAPLRDAGVPMEAEWQPNVTTGRRLGSLVEEVGRYPSNRNPMMIGYRLRSKKAVVLKITSFMPPASLDPDVIIDTFLALFELHAKLVKAAGRDDRLIIDFVDNGGGMVELANMLVAIAAPRHKTREKLCSDYASLINPFWQKWLQSFGGNWDKVEEAIRHLSEQDIDDMLNRISAVQLLSEITQVPVPLDDKRLQALIKDIKAAENLEAKRSRLIEALQHKDQLFGVADQLSMPFGALVSSNSEDGWFPFTGDVINPKTGKPFKPQMKAYSERQRRDWGGEEGDYTTRYQMACDLPFNRMLHFVLFLRGFPRSVSFAKAKHQWKEIAILTNGLCGSACALVQAKLQFSEGATVFTYGGVPGQLMDSAAFAGGNVEEYEKFWPRVLYAALIGDIIFGGSTPIGRQLRAPGAKKRHYADTLTLPLPTNAIASFNFNMMFIKELGPDALPREWYVMPGHKHYNEWHTTDAQDKSTWASLEGLYDRVANEDWAALRNNWPDRSRAGAEDVQLTCAAKPPTGWYVGEADFDVLGGLALAAVLLCCCGCCACSIWCVRRLCCPKVEVPGALMEPPPPPPEPLPPQPNEIELAAVPASFAEQGASPAGGGEPAVAASRPEREPSERSPASSGPGAWSVV